MTGARQFFVTRGQLALLLAAVFAANFAETQLEEMLEMRGTFALGNRIAQAFHEIEGGLNFAGAEHVSRWAVTGYAVSYFLLLPVLLAGAAAGCWRRESPQALRVFSFSVAFNYLLALPFYLFVPVPERWAYPPAKATLLSDLLSTRLIEIVRPISGLDNCFPSMHVALSVQVVLLAFWVRSAWRHSVLCAAGTVILSTFFLGIHWLPDMAMGLATAGLSFGLAVRLNRRWYGEEPAPAAAWPRPTVRTAAPYAYSRPPQGKLVFISYRRDGGSRLARVVQMELERRGFPCFLDVDDLGAEHFDDRLLQEIERAPNFVLILAPGSLERCHRLDDWLRREVVHAVKHGRNIVPLMADGFQFPPAGSLPEDLQSLPRLNGIVYSHEYFIAVFDKLAGFLKRG